MTIETHYEHLRIKALYAIALRDGVAHREGSYAPNTRDLEHCTDARAAIIERATDLSSTDWPRVRRAIADAGLAMPTGPLRFDTSGYGPRHTPYGSVCCSHTYPLDTPDYMQLAWDALRVGEWTRAADLAVDAYECYRRAVAQGVAVAPESGA